MNPSHSGSAAGLLLTAKRNLEANGFLVSLFDSAAEAAEYLTREIRNTTVGFGGSATLEEMGLFDALSVHNTVFWHNRLPAGKTASDMRQEASAAEVYLSSVNGLAATGEIVNIDNTGNRVGSIFFGHKKVYLVIGKNKLADDYDGALFRARNIAAPKNAQRLKRKTPCAIAGDRCYNCSSPDRICRGLSVLWKKPASGEFEIVLIHEDLGY